MRSLNLFNSVDFRLKYIKNCKEYELVVIIVLEEGEKVELNFYCKMLVQFVFYDNFEYCMEKSEICEKNL